MIARFCLIRLLGLLALGYSVSASGLEVFINTNSPAKVSRGSALFDRDAWAEAAKEIDGIWYVGQGMTKPPEGKSIGKARDHFIESFKDRRWIVEVQGRVMEGMGEGKHGVVHEIKAMKEGGVKEFSAMVFREDRNKDSTLNAEDVAAARAGLKSADVPKTPIIVNTRSFHKNKGLQNLIEKDKIDGFSFEFASNHIREGKLLETEVAPAIEFAVKNKKAIYLLITADHSKKMLEDIQDIFQRLNRSAGKALAAPDVKFVLSAYDGEVAIHMTPDRKGGDYANTTTGAALWLCNEADRLHLRKR